MKIIECNFLATHLDKKPAKGRIFGMWISKISLRYWWLGHFGPGSGCSMLQILGLCPEEAAGRKPLSTAPSPGLLFIILNLLYPHLVCGRHLVYFSFLLPLLYHGFSFLILFFNWWVNGFDLIQCEESCLPFLTKQKSLGRLNIPATTRLCSSTAPVISFPGICFIKCIYWNRTHEDVNIFYAISK